MWGRRARTSPSTPAGWVPFPDTEVRIANPDNLDDTQPEGVETAVKVAGPELGGVRIDSGDLGPVTRRVRSAWGSRGA